MKSQLRLNAATVLLSLWTCAAFYAAQPSTLFAQSTAFRYQGRLADNGSLASGSYDLRFAIYDSTNNPGVVIAGPLTNSPTGVSNGLFAVTLDFGAGVFDGSARWLEIGVRTNGSLLPYATLGPRQSITATPYGIYAAKAGIATGVAPGGVSGASLQNNVVTADKMAEGSVNAAKIFDAAVTNPKLADGAVTLAKLAPGAALTQVLNSDGIGSSLDADRLDGLDSSAFWQLGGNNGTVAGTQFLGTADNQPLELKVNNQRALRLEPNPLGAVNVIGGSANNLIAAAVEGATIGGGVQNTIATDSPWSVIDGGWLNEIGTNAQRSSIGGGYANGIGTGADSSVIAGGWDNDIGAASRSSTIAGGERNKVAASTLWSAILGGSDNSIGGGAFLSFYSAIGGGFGNSIAYNANWSVIAGGQSNKAGTNSTRSVISGGSGNEIGTASPSGVIGGGDFNRIGANSAYNIVGGGINNGVGEHVNSSAVAGGAENFVGAWDSYSVIGGGFANRIADSTIGGAGFSVIAGGLENRIGTNAHGTAIGGGVQNRIGVDSTDSVIGGGSLNAIGNNVPNGTISGGAFNTNLGAYATVPGGERNVAGLFSLAAGRRAKATNTGSFVWADSTGADFASTTADEFAVRALGGVRFVTGGAGVTVDGTTITGGGGGLIDGSVTTAKLADGAVTGTKISSGQVVKSLNGLTDAVTLAAGANVSLTPSGNTITISSAGTNGSPADGSVTTASLADGAVTVEKLNAVPDLSRTILSTPFTNPTPGVDGNFGYSVAAVGSDKVLIGAPFDNTGEEDAGAAYLFSTNGTLLTTFTNPTPAFRHHFGVSVAAVGSDKVLIGADLENIGTPVGGAAYLFSANGTLLTTFTNPAPTPGRFGFSVAAVGSDKVLIGTEAGFAAGAAYLFSTNGTLLTTFTNPAPAVQDYFGYSVAAVGSDKVLIGALADDTGATNTGAAYLFSINGTLLTTFNNPTPAADDFFGVSVAAIGSDRVLIGAYQDDTGKPDAGAAYLFGINGTLLTTFTNPAPKVQDFFGVSVVAVGSDKVLIGAYRNDIGALDDGAAYLFSTNGTLLTVINNPTPAAGDYFGYSVAALSSDKVLVGAYRAGAAYLFSLGAASMPGLISGGVVDGSITTASIGVLGLDASTITSGTLADVLLSGNVALRTGGNFFTGDQIIASGNVGIGTLSPPQEKLHVIGNILASGTITGSSDRNVKRDFASVNSGEVLEKVAALPISTWSYIAEKDVRHVGPMAQDFYAAFGVGTDDKHIATVDADGVALAAIQGLNQKVESETAALREELKRRDAENAELKRRLSGLEQLVLRLSTKRD